VAALIEIIPEFIVIFLPCIRFVPTKLGITYRIFATLQAGIAEWNKLFPALHCNLLPPMRPDSASA
tara:strand:- start:245 stop:442 length:198 start_codon:yes stop_codon:yes gene_type:complete